MAVYNGWTVEYKNGATWTAISEIVELSCQVGRRTATEQWPVSEAQIRVWYPNGHSSPLANLTIGTYIRFFAPGRSSTKPSWTGIVRNVIVELGIPWDSATSTGNADFLVIDCEGALGKVGRAGPQAVPVTDSNLAGKTRSVCVNACTYANVGSSHSSDNATQVEFSFWYDPAMPPYVFFWTDEPIQMINQCSALGNVRVLDGIRTVTGTVSISVDDPAVYFAGPNAPIATVGFSDTTNNATNREYDSITFDGLADLYFDAAEISYLNDEVGSSTATLTATANTGVVPPRTYQTQGPPNNQSQYTVNYENQAEYLANVFAPAAVGISSISATTSGQHTQNLDTLGVADLELAKLAAYIVPVTFRGATYHAQIEGVSVTADTSQSRFTYYLTTTDTSGWFTLDSSVLGVLDTNRLGIY